MVLPGRQYGHPLAGLERGERDAPAPGKTGPVTALALAAVLSLGSVALRGAAPPGPSYTADIEPLLALHCRGCHSQNTRMGGLLMETWDDLAKGGNRGPAVVAGDPGQSPLYLMVAGRMEPRMPFSAAALPPAEVETLRRWIEAGAPGPVPGEESVQVVTGSLPDIEPSVPVASQIFSVAYHPSGHLLATGRHGGVALTDSTSGQTVAFLDGVADIARAVAFSADGALLAAGGGHPQQGGRVQVWTVGDRRHQTAIEGHADTVQAVAFSPDGSVLATASYDKDIKLWDVSTGRELRTLRDHIDAVYALAFTPDGSRLLSGSADRSVKVWDPATGERLFTLGDPIDGVNSIAVHPSGKRVAAGGYDRTIRVWELGEDTGRLHRVLIAHRSPILRIAYSPDGSRIVTAATDRTIKVFDAETLEELVNLDRQADWVMSLAFSPDGGWLAAGRFDGSLSIYDSNTFRDHLTSIETTRESP